MKVEDLIQALALPESAQLNQRVPKKLLAEHGAATAADKRQIQEGVDEIIWLAALKPHLIGVPAFEDERRQYLELSVLHLDVKAGSPTTRLVELLHRSVPYPVLLFTSSDTGLAVSLAHLRNARNEVATSVLDGELLTVPVPNDLPVSIWSGFCAAAPLARQPQADLCALYQGWMDTFSDLDIACETGRFQPSTSRALAVQRHQALQRSRELQARLKQLRRQAQSERQMARQVELNHDIRAVTSQLAALSQTLTMEIP